MKSKLLLFPIGLSVALTGCIHSHMRDQAAVDNGGTVVQTTVPTSTRPAVRVYGDTPAPIVAPDTTLDTRVAPLVPMDDMDRAVAIRNMLQNEPALRMAAKNVDIEIKSGAAILRGTVRNETERQLLEQRISAYPGVTSMQDRLVIAP
jgi:BON domain-containing protein